MIPGLGGEATRNKWGGKRGSGFNVERDCNNLLSKHRAIGIDCDALDAMVERHGQEREAEKQSGLMEAQQWKDVDNCMAQRELVDMKNKYEADMALRNDWRFQHKSIKSRSEADLNPKFIKQTARPINPDLCSYGAAQNFDGEDRDINLRNQSQKDQMKDWCRQEADRKSQANELRKSQDYAEADNCRQVTEIVRRQEEAAYSAAQNERHEMQQYNKLLAREGQIKKNQEKLLQKQVDQWEVANNMNNPMLCEDPSVGYSYNGRKRGDHYKGMSNAEINDIFKANAVQQEEIRCKRQAEVDDDNDWKSRFDAMDEEMFECERQENGDQCANTYALADDNKYQRKEHKQQEKQRKIDLGDGEITVDFHKQFGGKCEDGVYRTSAKWTRMEKHGKICK